MEFATTGLSGDTLATLRPVLAQLSGGRVAAVVTQAGGLQVHCEALGRQVPRPVLVVAGPSVLPPDAVALASHAGLVMHASRRARDADEFARRYRQAAARLRMAVFVAPMSGDLALARRMTVGAVPSLLDAGHLSIHLLRCPPDDRTRLADVHQDAWGYHGDGLMVPCPALDDHLICPVAADEDGEDGGGLGALLRSLVRDDPRYAMGISDPLPSRPQRTPMTRLATPWPSPVTRPDGWPPITVMRRWPGCCPAGRPSPGPGPPCRRSTRRPGSPSTSSASR